MTKRGWVAGEPVAYLQGHGAVNRATHGQCRKGKCTPEYTSYASAKQRCTDQNCEKYPIYGGRGIKFLFINFEQFFAELGLKPKGMSLDRIDTNGNYESGNVRWATASEQQLTKRRYGKGYCWHKIQKKWVAYIYVKGKLINLGSFSLEKDAKQARAAAVEKFDEERAK
jgi:hypothetical protein